MTTLIDTSGDARFSRILPGLQVKVNSSSLGPFKACPRQYYYKIIRGLERPDSSVHLTFGTLVHKGSEEYDLNKLRGMSHEANVEAVLHWALRATWNFELNRPWQSGHSDKNRASLVRTLVWYFDQYAEQENLETVVLDSGTPAIELDFEFDSGVTSISTSETISFIGKLDKIVRLGDDHYIKDIKTTSYALDPGFFKKFTPDNQFSLYPIAGKVCYNRPVRGLILDAVQVGATFSRFARGLVPRDEETLDEWILDAQISLRQMESCAIYAHWPMNDRSCGQFGGCEFRETCSLKPSLREQHIARNFKVKDRTANEDVL